MRNGTIDRVLDLRAWPGLVVRQPLTGGHRNVVVEVMHERTGERFAARWCRRPPTSLAWELDLIEELAALGFRVPRCVPTAAGARSAGGVVVGRWLHGEEPVAADRAAVTGEIGRLHAVTTGRRQRPGSAGTVELMHAVDGADADLTAMPPDAVAACRAAWALLDGTPLAVVHGDPGPSNIRIHDGRVGLLDWDESRVDRTDLDLAGITCGSASDGPLEGARARRAALALDAWEAANAWVVEPAYARRRLDTLRSRERDGFHPR